MKIIIIILFSLFLINPINVYANSDDVVIIYSNSSVSKNEEFTITFKTKENVNFIESNIILDIPEYFMVVDEKPFYLPINSYFQDSDIDLNIFENDKARFIAYKRGESINNMQHICEIKLKALVDISKVDEYFKNITIRLYDSNNQIIPVNLTFSEGLKVEWLNDSYKILVNDEIPKFLNDVKVVNRKSEEYILKQQNNINNQVVGSYTVSLYIYDFVTNNTIYISKSINVVDESPPVIDALEIIEIKDDLLSIDNICKFQVRDNYDLNPIVIIKYYTSEYKLLNDKNEFFEYMKSNLTGFITMKAIDSSKNSSAEITQTIKIIDTIAPSINLTTLKIKDKEINDFNIMDIVKVFDNYDLNPKVNINKTNDIIKHELLTYYKTNIVISSIDNSGNKTIDTSFDIILEDTTPPNITKLKDLEIKDVDISKFESEIIKCIEYSDNFNIPVSFIITYYNKETINVDEFKDNLLKGINGYVLLKVVDSFNNESSSIKLDVSLIDTTPPKIEVLNIENNKKYLRLENVEYNVVDNVSSDLNVVVYLDNEVYSGSIINKIGKHKLVIEASDKSGNKSTSIINFEIIKNNLIGCGSDIDCYKNNYIDIIYFALILLGVISILIIIKIAYNRKRKLLPKDDSSNK